MLDLASNQNILEFIDKLDNLVAFHRKYPLVADQIKQNTSYLSVSSPLKRRVFHLKHGPNIPKCVCGVDVRWHHVKQSYNAHCSTKCANNNLSKIDKIRQTINDRYGAPSFSQSLMDPSSLVLLHNSEWMRGQHYDKEKSLHEIASDLKVDVTTVSNYCRLHSIKVRTFSRSHGERKLSTLLDNYQIVHIINTKDIIPPLELDIYIPSYNVAIEFSGLYWHSDKHERINANYHANKRLRCQEQGIQLITIFEDELLHQERLAILKILSVLKKDPRDVTYARHCSIKCLTFEEASKFLNDYHMQGAGRGSIRYGLVYKEQIVACMVFISQGNGLFTLNRYATSKRVVGGFSKLLSCFKKTVVWKTIISFADLRWSIGAVYLKCGFTHSGDTSPDYKYVDKATMKRVHKFNFRHAKLHKVIGEQYNPKDSEWVNLRRAGWHRIYDCGLRRMVLQNTQLDPC